MKKISLIIFILYTQFFLLTSSSLAISGCFCDENSVCYSDGCTRKPQRNDGTVDTTVCKEKGCGGAYNACYDTNSVDANRYFCTQQPPCCAEMAARNDPRICCWAERGYCHPYYCQQMDEPNQCGWYWTWHGEAPDLFARPYGYGCVKGSGPNDLKPVFGLPAGVSGPTTRPTEPPIPTQKPTTTPIPRVGGENPTPIPTNTSEQTPTTRPTQQPPPVFYTPPVFPTYVAPTTAIQPFIFSLPTFNLKEIIPAEKIEAAVEKPLSFPKYVLTIITGLDQQLETSINSMMGKMFK